MNTDQKTSPNYFSVALQSAFAAALFLGFPAGLLLWLVLAREASQLTLLDPFVNILQANGINKIVVLLICSLGWSYLLGRISGYRAWWRIGLATLLGILAAWYSPLSNLDGWFSDDLPIRTLYALTMCGVVFSVTLFVGFAYGIILRNIKAALVMGLSTSIASVLAFLFSIFIFAQFGIYVGSDVPLAMSKVTTVSLMFSAIVGGAVLGTMFAWFVEKEISQL